MNNLFFFYSIVVFLMAVKLWFYYDERRQQKEKPDAAMIDSADIIMDGIAHCQLQSELNFWVNEIGCFRKEYRKNEAAGHICERMYAMAFNKGMNMQLKTML